jgi:hypothetical protein
MRIILILTALILGAFSAIVFEAANASAVMNNRAAHARLTEAPDVRADLLAQAETFIENDPFQRTLWHGNASESASWISFLQAQAAQSPEKRLSYIGRARDFAEKSLRQAPISAVTWMRLAMLDENGIPNSLCKRNDCLARSYEAAPITRRELACARADAAIRAGMITTPSDDRIVQLGLSGVRSRTISKCLPSANQQFLFRAMLQMRRAEGRAKP